MIDRALADDRPTTAVVATVSQGTQVSVSCIGVEPETAGMLADALEQAAGELRARHAPSDVRRENVTVLRTTPAPRTT